MIKLPAGMVIMKPENSNNNNSPFKLVTPRATVEIHLPGEVVINGTRNAPVGDFFDQLPNRDNPPIVGAVVNKELRELTYPIQMDCTVEPVTMASADGMRIYRRSLTFLLETAFNRVNPSATLTVDHSVAFGGYFCQISNHHALTLTELARLEKEMRLLVEADLPFQRLIVPLEEAVEYFRTHGEEDKVSLLSHRKKDYLTMYQLCEHRDYHHGYMVPSTGYLKWFKLTPTGDGFTLRFPRRQAPTELQPLPDYPKLLATFREYGDWLSRLGISSVGALDNAIMNSRIHEIILVSEALHEQRIAEIARQITERKNQVRVVLIAGPTSSGKTTLSKRLSVQLLTYGLTPFPLEMDHYFVDRDQTPLGDDGKPDFEAIDALDRNLLSSDLRRLINGERIHLPRYDFKIGKRQSGETVQLHPNDLIILEGIHGLNPELLPALPEQQAFRVYVSALTQLNLDHYNRVSTTDTRLIRRIARDASQRGYTAQQTIQRWESVRRGERRFIYPYQENADAMFNSALAYELSALKPIAEPLLRQVPFGTVEYIEAKRLLAFLEWFLPIEPELIPDNSILREFIGNSILRNFSLWHNHLT